MEQSWVICCGTSNPTKYCMFADLAFSQTALVFVNVGVSARVAHFESQAAAREGLLIGSL
jgi:hypothetical protein